MGQIRSKEAGFTLVEIIVVISIMAILATMVTINVSRVLERSRITRIQADIKLLETAADQYLYSASQTNSMAEGDQLAQAQLVAAGILPKIVQSPLKAYDYTITIRKYGQSPAVVLEKAGVVYQRGNFLADSTNAQFRH